MHRIIRHFVSLPLSSQPAIRYLPSSAGNRTFASKNDEQRNVSWIIVYRCTTEPVDVDQKCAARSTISFPETVTRTSRRMTNRSHPKGETNLHVTFFCSYLQSEPCSTRRVRTLISLQYTFTMDRRRNAWNSSAANYSFVHCAIGERDQTNFKDSRRATARGPTTIGPCVEMNGGPLREVGLDGDLFG